MKLHLHKIFKYKAQIILLALTLGIGVGYVLAADSYMDPSSAPPGNNTPPPINVSDDVQTKIGPLTAMVLVTPNLTVNMGTAVTPGSILMADKDNSGHVIWGPPPTGGTGAGNAKIVRFIPATSQTPKNITYSACTSYNSDFSQCTSYAAPTSKTISSILANTWEGHPSMISNDVETLNAVCGTLYPDAQYGLSYTYHEWGSEKNNGVLIWVKGQGLVLRSARTLNHGTEGFLAPFLSPITCTSIPNIAVN